YTKFKKLPESELGLPRTWNPKEVIRTGLQITNHLYYNTLSVPSCALSIPDNTPLIGMRTYWHCKECRKTYSFTKDEVLHHATHCLVDSASAPYVI
ncbi:hypothetical protein BDF14DRAFT_1726608, partial [Spinellus fusiger]